MGTTPLDPDSKVTPPSASMKIESRADIEAALYELTLDRGNISDDDLPDVTWVTITTPGQGHSYDYTVLTSRIFENHGSILGGALTGLSRLPKRDSLSVVRGHIGAFPQLFLDVPMEKVGEVAKAIRGTREPRVAVRTSFEVRRNSPEFGEFLDAAHKKLLDEHPLEAGILDTSRYLWPLSLQSDPAGAVE